MEGIWLRMRKRDRISLNGKEREKGGQAGRPTGGVRKLRVNGVAAFGPRLVRTQAQLFPPFRTSIWSQEARRGRGSLI